MCNSVESKSTHIPALDPLRYGTLERNPHDLGVSQSFAQVSNGAFRKKTTNPKSHRHETHERALLGKKLWPETMCASVTSCHSQSAARTLIICLSHIFFFLLVVGKRSVQEGDRDANNSPHPQSPLAPRFRRRSPRQSPRCPSAPLTPTSRDGKRNKITTGNYEAVARVRTTRRVFLERTITVLSLSPPSEKILAKKKIKEKKSTINRIS